VKLATVFVLWSLAVMRVGAATISVQPTDLAVAPGQTFSLNVDALDVVDLYAFQFDINFTSGLLLATGVTEGGFLPGGGSTFFIPGTVDNSAGTILFSASTLIGDIPGVNGTGTLATIDFTGFSSGISPITLSNATLLNSTLLPISADQTGGSVTIVPEPAYYAFFGALMFVGSLMFRRSNATRRYRRSGEGDSL
jgi:Cohesin domain